MPKKQAKYACLLHEASWRMCRVFVGVIAAVGGLSVSAGGIEYPALGNFDLREGTLEVWFTPATELYPALKEDEYRSIFRLFSMTVPGHFGFNAHWYGRGNVHGLHVSMSHSAMRDGLIPLPARQLKWNSNEPHHVAMTWRGNVMDLWADGEHVSHRNQAMAFSGGLAGQHLIVGGSTFRDTPIIVHAVRTSNIARAREQLKDAEAVADLFTLLLDRFDAVESVSEEGRTRPAVISKLNSQRRGLVKGKYHFVAAPLAGVALFQKEKGKK